MLLAQLVMLLSLLEDCCQQRSQLPSSAKFSAKPRAHRFAARRSPAPATPLFQASSRNRVFSIVLASARGRHVNRTATQYRLREPAKNQLFRDFRVDLNGHAASRYSIASRERRAGYAIANLPDRSLLLVARKRRGGSWGPGGTPRYSLPPSTRSGPGPKFTASPRPAILVLHKHGHVKE